MADAFNIATGAEAASDITVWSTTTGGANDRGIPTSADVAIYDANSTGTGVWDIADVESLHLKAAYAGTLPLSVNLAASGGFVQVDDGVLGRGTFDITCDTDFIVATAGALTGTTGTIAVGDGGTGDCTIASGATATAAFSDSIVDLRGTGNLANPTAANKFGMVNLAASGMTTTLTANTLVTNTTFGGGTLDTGVAFELEYRPLADVESTLGVGSDTSTIIGTGIIDIIWPGGATLNMTGFSSPAGFNMSGGSGSTVPQTMNFLGDISPDGTCTWRSDANKLITTNLLGFKFECGFHNMGTGTQSMVLNGGTGLGSRVVTGTISYNGPNNALLGDGTLTCTKLANKQGTMDVSGWTITNTGDHEVDSGATFDLGTGNILTTGAFVPVGDVDFGNGVYETSNASFDLSGANSITYGTDATIKFSGTATQTPDFGAVVGKNITDVKTSGDIAPTSKLDITGRLRTCAAGNHFLTFLVAVTNAVGEFQTVGTGALETSIRSSSAATKADIVVARAGHIQRHSGWKDTNVTGAIVNVDTLTGSNDGNNTEAGAEGLLFAEHPIVPSNGKGLGLGLGLGFKLRN